VAALSVALLGDPAAGELRGANCSETSCYNAESLCGEFKEPCEAVGPPSFGVQIWRTATSQFQGDFSYRRVERSAFDLEACERGDHWLEVVFDGHWTLGGGSHSVLGLSLASKTVVSAYVTLLQDNPCLTPVNGLPSARCFNALLAIQGVCPCNGWDWSARGTPEAKDIGMFCSPEDQCPLIHQVYLQQTQYFSYNASKASACFGKANTLKVRGWEQPQDDLCVAKVRESTCPSALAGAMRWPTSLWHFLLVMLVLSDNCHVHLGYML
ncbi:unnamed protein product, partial [Polarella glacialis]